jgi:hypothetical protein
MGQLRDRMAIAPPIRCLELSLPRSRTAEVVFELKAKGTRVASLFASEPDRPERKERAP